MRADRNFLSGMALGASMCIWLVVAVMAYLGDGSAKYGCMVIDKDIGGGTACVIAFNGASK